MSGGNQQDPFQQTYPSAFDMPQQAPQESSVFGAPATLPGPPVSVSEPASAPRRVPTNVLPRITPEQIKDPVLRAKLFGASEQGKEESITQADSGQAVLAEPPATSLQPTVYPSASPQTASIPLPEYKPKAAGSRQRLSKSFKSFVSANHSVNQPMRGVANVAQRQFTLAAQRRQQYVEEKEQAREVLNFTVRLAETMFHFGADARDVDSAIVAICASYGLDDVEVNVTNQSVIVNYVSDPGDSEQKQRGVDARERFSHTVVRVVRTRSDNYSSLTDIYALIHSITEKGLSRSRAERRLQEINRSKKLYSPLLVRVSELMMAGFFTLGVGGSWRAALVAVIVAVAALAGMNLGSAMRLPSFFRMAIGSGIMTAGALWVGSEGSFAQELGFSVSSPHVVAAGLILFLPTASMVSAAQDALTGYPLTAAGKFVTTALDFLGLVVGIAMALTVMSYFDSATLDVQQTVFNPPPVWLSIGGMILGSVAAVGAAQGTVKNMLWIFLISGAGQLVYNLFALLTGLPSSPYHTAVGALTVGALSAFIAYKVHAPQLTFYLPGFLFLLPGLSIFRGLYSVIIDPSPVAGISSLVATFSTIIAMASGVVLGSYIVHFILQKAVEGGPAREVQPLDR